MPNDIVKYFVLRQSPFSKKQQRSVEQALVGILCTLHMEYLNHSIVVGWLVGAVVVAAAAAATSWQPLKYPLSELWPYVSGTFKHTHTLTQNPKT